MKKIVFGITSLQPGGAERVLIDIANALSEKYKITIFCLYGEGAFLNQVNKKVTIKCLVKKSFESLSKMERKKISLALQIPFLRKRIYKKEIQGKYDLAIAFLEGPITWLFAYKDKMPKYAWIHNDIQKVFGKGLLSKVKEKVNNKCYGKFDRLVFVSEDNLEKFTKCYPQNSVKKEVIYNYINSKEVLKKAKEEQISFAENEITFLQVSRLVEQKAVERLLNVHERLIKEGYHHKIYILGDGPLKEMLEKQISEKKLENTFILLGQRKNPYPYIKACNYFILTSYYEGYPMVLMEAKIFNKFILITDTAAREVVKGYEENSKIVSNDKEGIYNGLKYILEKKPKCLIKSKEENEKNLNKIVKLIEEEVK